MTPHEDELDQVEALLREWLAVPDITLTCGRWSDGTIMELIPDGNATLSGKAYSGRFKGLRDLNLRGERHHIHLDLARLCRVTYAVTPSVCYGYRPSFEVRLRSPESPSIDEYGLAVSVRTPYRNNTLQDASVEQYFRRLFDHARRFPALVDFHADSRGSREELGDELAATWRAVGAAFARARGDDAGATPASPDALRAAYASSLEVRDAR